MSVSIAAPTIGIIVFFIALDIFFISILAICHKRNNWVCKTRCGWLDNPDQYLYYEEAVSYNEMLKMKHWFDWSTDVRHWLKQPIEFK